MPLCVVVLMIWKTLGRCKKGINKVTSKGMLIGGSDERGKKCNYIIIKMGKGYVEVDTKF